MAIKDHRPLLQLSRVTPVRLTRVEFVNRIGATDWDTLQSAAATDPQLKFALDQMALAAYVELQHPRTRQFAAHCVAQAYITQQRADEILAEVYQPGESGP